MTDYLTEMAPHSSFKGDCLNNVQDQTELEAQLEAPSVVQLWKALTFTASGNSIARDVYYYGAAVLHVEYVDTSISEL